jgi:hypothetical protein
MRARVSVKVRVRMRMRQKGVQSSITGNPRKEKKADEF